MNTKKYVVPIAFAAATITLAACGTNTAEPAAAPSSSASPYDELEVKKAEMKAAERDLDLHGVLALPANVDRVAAEDAARQALPFAFAWQEGCMWLRTWDAALWPLHGDSGGTLTRSRDDETRFRTYPGALSARTCDPVGSIPTADDPSVSTPFRWRAGDRTLVRVKGVTFELPNPIPERGVALRPAN